MGEGVAASGERGIEALVETFESFVGRYPAEVREAYLACDAAAMRAAWDAAIGEGAVAEDLPAWDVRCLSPAVIADQSGFLSRTRTNRMPNGGRSVAVLSLMSSPRSAFPAGCRAAE